MARHKWKSSGKPKGGKTGVCTYCRRVHLKGKKQKEQARKSGWESCSSVATRIKQKKD